MLYTKEIKDVSVLENELKKLKNVYSNELQKQYSKNSPRNLHELRRLIKVLSTEIAVLASAAIAKDN